MKKDEKVLFEFDLGRVLWWASAIVVAWVLWHYL